MKVIGLNFNDNDKKLETDFAAGLGDTVEYVSLRAAEITLLLKRGVVTAYTQTEVIDLKPDLAFVRGRGMYAHMTSLLMCLFRFYGVKTRGSASAGEFTHNDGKINQMVHFTLHQLPMPDSIVFPKSAFAFLPKIVADSQLSFPLVLKRTGAKGSSVWKVESFQEIEGYLESEQQSELFLLQEYIPNTFDIRALFFGGQLIGAMARKSADGFYNNASKGAEVETITLTDEEIELSAKACAVLGQDLSGVDIVRSERGPLFFEINNRPGYEGFERATGIDVGFRLAQITQTDLR